MAPVIKRIQVLITVERVALYESYENPEGGLCFSVYGSRRPNGRTSNNVVCSDDCFYKGKQNVTQGGWTLSNSNYR
jgi:hypothetical protein